MSTTLVPSSTRKAAQPAARKTTATFPRSVPASHALSALRDGPAVNAAPNFLFSFLLATVSLGIIPALRWPMRFRQFADANHKSLRALAEWGQPRLLEDDGRRLMQAADRVRFYPSLLTLGMTGVVTALAAVAWGMTQVWPQTEIGSWFMSITYGSLWPRYSQLGSETRAIAFTLWTLGLVAAYTAHLLQVHLHAHFIRKFLDEFNQLTIAEGYTPVLLDPIGFGCSPFWILTTVGLLMLSGAWGVPLGIAGATERRLRHRAVKKLRCELADRVRDVIFAKARAAEVNLPAAAYCATPGCRRPLAKGVKFCPRCGAKAGRSIDRKA